MDGIHQPPPMLVVGTWTTKIIISPVCPPISLGNPLDSTMLETARTPTGVRSPVARQAIDESSIASVGKTYGETNVDARDGDVGPDSTPTGVRSPVAR